MTVAETVRSIEELAADYKAAVEDVDRRDAARKACATALSEADKSLFDAMNRVRTTRQALLCNASGVTPEQAFQAWATGGSVPPE